MYSIGEFSKINRVTPKTLRHYDRIGLLKPEKIDQWTGYRYYSARQLPIIQKILLYKGMGFSLDEIQDVISGTDHLRSLLQLQEKKIAGKIAEEEQRLQKVRNYLKSLDGGDFMKKEIQIKALPEVIVASMRTTIPNYDTYFDIVPKMGEYMDSVGAVCRDPFYCFTIYHDGEYKESDIDVEICEAVVAPCKDSEKVVFKTIEEVPEAACLMHKGPYSTLPGTYNHLFSWIEEMGYEPAGFPRESYIDGIWNQENPELWTTELQVPIKRKGAGNE